jgi:hypothetical protein
MTTRSLCVSPCREPTRALSPFRSGRYLRLETGWTPPCADIFELSDGEIRRFDCYPEGVGEFDATWG